MSDQIRPIAFMPMRHTSERVPGKNYRDFNGTPLYQHVLRQLLEVDRIAKVVIDTDSDLLLEQIGAEFPEVACVRRPEHLLGGETPMTAVLGHDAELFPNPWYLQTHSTNPLLTARTIERAIIELEENLDRFDSLFSVTRHQTRLFAADGTPLNHDPTVLIRTQDLEPVFEENSNIYLFTNTQIESGFRFGQTPLLFELNPLEATDIDEESDFILAETLQQLQLRGAL